MQVTILAALTGLEVFHSIPVLAYIGPGLGAGTIAVILGVIGSIFLALFSIIWYPLKRLLRRRRQNRTEETPETTTDGNSK